MRKLQARMIGFVLVCLPLCISISTLFLGHVKKYLLSVRIVVLD